MEVYILLKLEGCQIEHCFPVIYLVQSISTIDWQLYMFISNPLKSGFVRES